VEVTQLDLQGLVLIRPRVFNDTRGWFLESYNAARYAEAGVVDRFVQDNHSRSAQGTLRGLHYQEHPGQSKLVSVAVGRILDVAVDIRPASPTFGKWTSVELDADTHAQLYIPIGFAHGFCVLSDVAEVMYKVSSLFDAGQERTLSWDDPEIGVVWPVESPVLSARDCQGESFAAYRQRVKT